MSEKDIKKLRDLSIELNRKLKEKMGVLQESLEDLRLRTVYLKFENEALKREKAFLEKCIEDLAQGDEE